MDKLSKNDKDAKEKLYIDRIASQLYGFEANISAASSQAPRERNPDEIEVARDNGITDVATTPLTLNAAECALDDKIEGHYSSSTFASSISGEADSLDYSLKEKSLAKNEKHDTQANANDSTSAIDSANADSDDSPFEVVRTAV
ncbi:hypothetical protein LPJ57_002313, partial [Coemansia sp. RSA 486]